MSKANHEPGPELRIMDHDAPGTWLSDMRARGFTVPLQLCRDVSHGMRALSFADVFRLLWRHRKILRVGRVIIPRVPASAWSHLRHWCQSLRTSRSLLMDSEMRSKLPVTTYPRTSGLSTFCCSMHSCSCSRHRSI